MDKENMIWGKHDTPKIDIPPPEKKQGIDLGLVLEKAYDKSLPLSQRAPYLAIIVLAVAIFLLMVMVFVGAVFRLF